MKKLIAFASLLAMMSCATAYQQIASIASPQLKLTDDGRFFYDKDDYVVDYNFWAAGGTVSFVLTNNSDNDVYVDLSRSFLVVNGMTFDYFQNRRWSTNATNTITTSSSYGNSYTVSSALATAMGSSYSSGNYANAHGIGSSSGNSRTSAYASRRTVTNTVNRGVEITEKEGVWVPAHSSRSFSEFSLFDIPYRKCGFARNPSKSEDMTVKFNEGNTPYSFENMIMLVVGEKDYRIVNKFYIETLTNIREDLTYEEIDEKDCNDESTGEKIRIYKFSSPNKFYIKYNLDSMAGNSAVDRVKKGKVSNKATANKEPKKGLKVGKKSDTKKYDDGLF